MRMFAQSLKLTSVAGCPVSKPSKLMSCELCPGRYTPAAPFQSIGSTGVDAATRPIGSSVGLPLASRNSGVPLQCLVDGETWNANPNVPGTIGVYHAVLNSCVGVSAVSLRPASFNG